MSRIVNRPLHVPQTDDMGRPRAYVDEDGSQRTITEYLDTWREMGQWVTGEGERVVYRVLTADMAIIDLERRWDGQWMVYRVWD
jgi:hypothetical protein